MTGALPGDDWQDVPADTERTVEQSARRFLSLPWEQQVEMVRRMRQSQDDAMRCWMSDHPRLVQHNEYLLERMATLSTGGDNPVESVTNAEELEAARQRGIEYGRALGYSDGHHAGRAEGIANLADRITHELAESL